jgi:uncharacterized protein (TIGR02271 family)
MSRTITAFFDSRSDAEAARMRLTEAGIDAGRAQIIDQSQTGSSGSSGMTGGGSSDGQGFWASVKEAFMPDEDRYAYEEGMRRGGYLLCAQVDESQADEAIRILDQEGTVDFDRRQDEWRSEGWSGYAGGSVAGAGLAPGGMTSARSGNTVEEERIPIVEEELRVGKREVERGGARVRSFMREIPVHEQVNLREEHVSVERRPVNETLSAGELNSGDLMRDRTIEMTETAEEAVVGKEARVREELVVKKTAEERTEEINETVRRTEVDVDEGARTGTGTGTGDRSAFGFKEGSGGSSGGTGATGSESREREPQGSGYTDRIDKSGF